MIELYHGTTSVCWPGVGELLVARDVLWPQPLPDGGLAAIAKAAAK